MQTQKDDGPLDIKQWLIIIVLSSLFGAMQYLLLTQGGGTALGIFGGI